MIEAIINDSDAGAHLEGSARHRLQHHQLLQAGGQRHARRRRSAPAWCCGPAGRHLDRDQGRAHHRRPHPARRRRRRSRRDHLAAAVRHGQGQVLPAAVRSAVAARRPSASASSRLRSTTPSSRPRRSTSRRDWPTARRTRSAGPSTRSNNWLRMAGPTFDTSLALEFMGFNSPDVHGRACFPRRETQAEIRPRDATLTGPGIANLRGWIRRCRPAPLGSARGTRRGR